MFHTHGLYYNTVLLLSFIKTNKEKSKRRRGMNGIEEREVLNKKLWQEKYTSSVHNLTIFVGMAAMAPDRCFFYSP